MKLISELEIAGTKSLQLFKGDLTEISKEHALDFLLLSVFPDNYLPTTTSLIGALYRKGLNVAKLADQKELDLRAYSHCWISKEINYPNIKRILSFEPKPDPFANPYGQMAEIFQSLSFISKTHSIKTIGLPLLMTGEQNYDVHKVIEELINTCILWLQKKPFETIKIVEISDRKINLLKTALEEKAKLLDSKKNDNSYDFFVSYSRKNKKEVDLIQKLLGDTFKLFIDSQEIKTGTNWLDKVNKAMAGSKRFIVCLSDTFVSSKVCNYEYSFCNLKYIKEGSGVVLPLYLYSADLPFEMRIINFYDAREGNLQKVEEFCNQVLAQYSP